ncbi:MAG: hypothetical protein ABI383_03165 [Acidobacteriaceae bacterium]
MQLTRRHLLTQSTALLIANVVGAVLYVFAASRGGWAIPEERAAGIYTTTGEPFIWFSGILPIVATFFVINLVWAVKIFTARSRPGGRLWLLAAAVWFVAVVIDFAHH